MYLVAIFGSNGIKIRSMRILYDMEDVFGRLDELKNNDRSYSGLSLEDFIRHRNYYFRVYMFLDPTSRPKFVGPKQLLEELENRR